MRGTGQRFHALEPVHADAVEPLVIETTPVASALKPVFVTHPDHEPLVHVRVDVGELACRVASTEVVCRSVPSTPGAGMYVSGGLARRFDLLGNVWPCNAK